MSDETRGEREADIAQRTRELLTAAVQRFGSQPGFDPSLCTVLLSGGVDSSVAASLAYSLLGVRHAISIIVTPSIATDGDWADAVAASLPGMEHVVLRPSLEALLSDHMPFTCQVLESFDPMSLRNSVTACAALRHAAEKGFKFALTGDAADELLGGYAFSTRLPDDQWAEQRAGMVRSMHFDSQPLGRAVGMTVSSPFLDDAFIKYAMTLSKADCVGPVSLKPSPSAPPDAEPTLNTGKLPLRRAFPDSVSAWRRKDPAEIGSGTTMLGAAPWAGREGYFDSRIGEEEFEEGKAGALADHGVVLRDREHLAYFRIFVRAFAENGDGPLNVPGRPRPNDDPCPTCGFRLGTPDATFCVVCGHYDTALKDRHSKKEQEEGKGT